ncbi:ATP-binding protein [Acidovorax soli]|uniref:ATP-binding protein n=1 Tax=Acidovorax TaxID=12916 RepID=UPI0026F09DF4|nr:ATP-binding protein [Acidovorax soli]MCM2347838.1 ATP-binding protein [Acidovorax soli]
MLLNLLKNALDAHRAAGRADAPITIHIECQGDRLAIAVQDQGAPLSDAERARLFEPFYTTRPDGLGLGLAICRGIAETHGGALQARPAGAAGEPGMVFELLLPLALPAVSALPALQETTP